MRYTAAVGFCALALLAMGLTVNFVSAGLAEETSAEALGGFELPDFRGKTHRLSDYAEEDYVVVAVLGTECPLARLYGPRLQQLADAYDNRSVAFLGINANVQDTLTEIEAYARRHNIRFPILKDLGNRLVDKMGAERTPEVFLLDQDRVVRYRGRIDNQYGVGYVREKPTETDLRTALDQLLAGEAVTTPVTEAAGCHIGRVQEPDESSDVTYSNQIVRLLQENCIACHREGEIGPFSLTSYDEVVGSAEMIGEVVAEERMPPWHASPEHGSFKNDRRLSAEDKQLILDWVAAGAPAGDLGDLPPPPAFVEGWQLPREPDLVVPVTTEPFNVPAEGEVRYQYFVTDPQLKEDKWIAAAELQPGNRAVVHHILVFTRPAGSKGRLGEDALSGYLVGYVPGLRVEPYPKGMAKRIPAGSELVFQVHYTPIGSEQLDQSRLGLVFADHDTITHEVVTSSAANSRISIPPHAANHREEAKNRRPIEDSLLLSMSPHMHLRGKAFRYEARFPDGTTTVLLDVPRYDFNWQTNYRLREPLPLPEGTRIHCTAYFDNSEENPHNPAPGSTVRWGDQTWEEMLIGYFDVAIPYVHPQPDEAARAARRSGYRPLVRLSPN